MLHSILEYTPLTERLVPCATPSSQLRFRRTTENNTLQYSTIQHITLHTCITIQYNITHYITYINYITLHYTLPLPVIDDGCSSSIASVRRTSASVPGSGPLDVDGMGDTSGPLDVDGTIGDTNGEVIRICTGCLLGCLLGV